MQRTPMVDYDTAHHEFAWEIPASFNFGADVVDRYAEDPARVALIWYDAAGREVRPVMARRGVTIHGIDQETCISAGREARRIAGAVVVRPASFHLPTEMPARQCRDLLDTAPGAGGQPARPGGWRLVHAVAAS